MSQTTDHIQTAIDQLEIADRVTDNGVSRFHEHAAIVHAICAVATSIRENRIELDPFGFPK